MEQTFRIGTEQGSLRPVSGKLLMRMDFPRSEIAHFLQFHNVYSAKSCILSNYTSHEKLDFRHPYFPFFSDSGATAHSVIFRKLPMCTFRQKLRPK